MLNYCAKYTMPVTVYFITKYKSERAHDINMTYFQHVQTDGNIHDKKKKKKLFMTSYCQIVLFLKNKLKSHPHITILE